MSEIASRVAELSQRVEDLKVPPHSIEAEQSVLGGLMLDNRAWEQIGDLVNVAGNDGFAEEVEIYTTVLRLPDKTKIIIPNGQIMSDVIVNFTEAEKRRVDLLIGIGYDDDIDQARDVILAAIKQSEYVLDDPAPAVSVAELGDNSVNLAVRPWVMSATYAPASHEITERVKKALDANGISIPYPQRDVHIYNHDKS